MVSGPNIKWSPSSASLIGDLAMDAEYTIELASEDPVLDFPWKDPSGKLSYVDIKRHPELISTLVEAERFPELAEFLTAINSARSVLETAKCDVWETDELTPEEEVFEASHKFASYIDLVFIACGGDPPRDLQPPRLSFSSHENLARQLVELLRKAPAPSSTCELCVRRCFYEGTEAVQEGFYFTLYVNGYGADQHAARQHWEIGLRLVKHALLQLSSRV